MVTTDARESVVTLCWEKKMGNICKRCFSNNQLKDLSILYNTFERIYNDTNIITQSELDMDNELIITVDNNEVSSVDLNINFNMRIR